MEILNQFQINENIFTSGQPDEIQIKEMASKGYKVVINLAMPDHENSISSEGSIVTSHGMTYIHIPVPFDAPKLDHLKTFSDIMDIFKDKKVWVHCIVNARVSAFLFCYLQNNRDYTAKKASTSFFIEWLPKMNDVWKQFINYAPNQL